VGVYLTDQKIIDTRSSFHELLNHVFSQNKELYLEYGKIEYPHLKTYFLESNYPEDYDFSRNIPKEYKLYKSNEEDFYRLANKENKNAGFLDTSRGRIWQFFSLEKSEKSDSFVKKWADNTINLDRCWQSNDTLKKYETEYTFRGIGIKFDDIFTDYKDRNSLSLKLWTKRGLSEIEDQLYQLVKKEYYRTSTRIQEDDPEDKDPIFLNEIYYDGKVTTTFSKTPDHLFNFNRIFINKYVKLLEIIEDRRGVFGEPIEILFDRSIDIQKIANYFTTGKYPFRLLLVKHKEKDDFIGLHGLDLHTHQPISIDIGLDYIWINIPKITCGNAGIRIPTLLGFQILGKKEIVIGGEKLFV